jgi:hypothetical protein
MRFPTSGLVEMFGRIGTYSWDIRVEAFDVTLVADIVPEPQR